MKKNLIREKDYDFYSVKLPIRMAFSRKKRRVVLRELEKRHPNLTASSCYDSKIRLSKKGFYADVAVIEKSLLARYRSLFPGKKLYLEGRKSRSCFSTGRKNLIPVFLLLVTAGFFGCREAGEVIGRHKKISEAE